jgi:UDP-N-acetylglucosamine acyltransferase
MVTIHPSALVEKGAVLGEDVSVGPFAVVEAGAEVGDRSTIGPQAYLTRWARLGEEVKIYKGAVVGTDPQDLKFGGEATTFEIGDRTVVREFATLNRGTEQRGKSVVGSDCLLMAYAHVAHDSLIGDHVIIANAVQPGGHITIEDWAILGGGCLVHQFVRIGAHSFIGGGCKVPQDVPPFSLVGGDPSGVVGINSVGLRRRGFSREQIAGIKQAHKLIYRSGLNTRHALDTIREQFGGHEEAMQVHGFIEASRGQRGIMGRGNVVRSD